jgi:MFS family permease
VFNRSISFVVAGAAGAATLMAASAPSPLYPVYQRLWGFSAFTLTAVFAVYVAALLIALLTVGSLSDRVGRRPVVSGALILLALGMLLFAISSGTGDLLVARIVQGFAVGTATGTVTAMILDSGPSPRLASIVSSAVQVLGTAIGAVLAGALVEFAPFPRQLVFWIVAAVYLVLAALVWFIPEPSRAEATRRESVWRSLRPSLGLPPATRSVFFALVPSIGAAWALSGLYLSLGSSIIGTVFGVHSHFVIGIVLGVFFVGGMVGTVISALLPPSVREWFGYGNLALGIMLTIAAMLMNGLPLYVVGSAIAGLGFGAAFRFAVNALGEAAPFAERGQVFATMYIVSYVAFSVPALAAGLAVGRFGLEPTAVAYGAVDIALVVIATIAGIVQARRRVSENERTEASSPSRTVSTI